jgi:hypothetical protein
MMMKFFSAILSALVLAAASVGVTAFAEETATEQTTSKSTVEEKATENEKVSDSEKEDNPVNVDVDEVMDYINKFADAENAASAENGDNARPDYYGDDYYDTKGNATLIKSEHIIYNTEEMQFIAVTTKDGHVFYVLINYSAENGEDNVYFLNKVDAIDLYTLIYMKDEEKESGIDINNVKKAEETAFEAFSKEKSSAENWEDSIETDISDTDTVEQEKPEQKPMSSNNMYLIIGAAVILCIGGAGFFIMKKKPAKKNNVVMEDDEDINFYDNDEEFNEDNE